MDFTEFFTSLAAHSSLVYFCYRPADGRVLYVSPAYAHQLGGQVARVNEELPAWWAALHPDDRPYLRDRFAHVVAGGAMEGLQLRLLRPDGGTRWLCMSASSYSPAADPAGLLVSGYVEDMTVRKEIMNHAQRYQAKKNSMLEILSHDLASPLTLAEQMSDYLEEKVAPLADAELNQMLRNMRASCREGVDLIRDFVEQEFLDSSNVELSLTRLDLAARLQLLVDNYRQRQHATGHQFYFESSHPSIYAEVDDNKFLQVINNLIGNSLKFTPDGGHIHVAISQHPAHVLVSVADTGIGIPATLQARLFERFTPARRVGLRGEKSTGLGMSIIKTIVEWHRGHIMVESQEGHGTLFTIQLPLPK